MDTLTAKLWTFRLGAMLWAEKSFTYNDYILKCYEECGLQGTNCIPVTGTDHELNPR